MNFVLREFMDIIFTQILKHLNDFIYEYHLNQLYD